MDTTQEISAGAVVYKIKDNIKHFLLVYSVRNNEWSFPKGHIEENETEMEAAKREIFEETGISDLTFIDGFKISDSYMIKGTLPHTVGSIIKKNVIYYLCCTNSDFVSPNDNEINKCKWVTYANAMICLVHKQQKNILNAANKYLEGDVR